MKLLVAVKSCRRDMDRGCHDAIRATWGQTLFGKAHLRFFVGNEANSKKSRTFKSDEIAVDAEDDYHSLPFKTRAICQWAVSKRIGSIFLCDNDTYVKVPKLLSCDYGRYDYAGKISRPVGETFSYEAIDRNGISELIPKCHPWASGGYGYFLSQKAITLVAETYPKGWAEDLWVGNVLGPEIAKGNLTALDLPAEAYSTHFPSARFGGGYDPVFGWMEKMHEANQ